MDEIKRDKSAKDRYSEVNEYLFATPEIRLGPWTSYSLIDDPKHMCFVLSRYKFCAKMLEGKVNVMEIGSGDGFGLPIVAQAVEHVYSVDWDDRHLVGNARRLAHLKNVTYVHTDLNEDSPQLEVDAAFSIDVIEHIEPSSEATFMENVMRCLKPNGVLITGTPNIPASQYASPVGELHINLKSMKTLRELMKIYFENVFMFGMNDEVIHTGFAPMCHYIWSVGAGVRSEWQKKK